MAAQRPGISTATWILLSLAILLSLYLYHTMFTIVSDKIDTPMPQQPPAPDIPTDEPATIDLSIDSLYQFETPPPFEDETTQEKDELQEILTRKHKGRVSVSGEVFVDKTSKHQDLQAIEGARVDVELSTE